MTIHEMALLGSIRELKSQIAKLEADKRRLDWIREGLSKDLKIGYVKFNGLVYVRHWVGESRVTNYGRTLDEAIDKAMA